MPPKTRKVVGEEDMQEMLSGLETRLDERFDCLANDIISIKETVIKRLAEENARLKQRVNDLEVEVYKSQQYDRRNNIELNGIPSSVDQMNLESTVIKVLESIDVRVNEADIEACHRLNKTQQDGSKTTIVRFVNRKHCERIMRNKKKFSTCDRGKLGYSDQVQFYASSNLCPYYSFLAWKCRQLRKANLIHATWETNGTINIRIHENDKNTKIYHENEINKLFPDFFSEDIEE